MKRFVRLEAQFNDIESMEMNLTKNNQIPERKKIIASVKRVVIKIGTNVLTAESHQLDTSLMEHLCQQVCWLMAKKKQVIVVTSAAIGAGMQILGWKKRPVKMEKLQAAASVGQSRLMRFYERIFREQGYNVGQVLLTKDIFESKSRKANALAAIETLLSYKIVPIINENDVVTTDEIRFGDNDFLSAMVFELLNADMLILLTDVDGLFDADPKNNGKVNLLSEVNSISDHHIAIAKRGTPSSLGRGGMISKILAIKKVLELGGVGLIANGKRPWVIRDIFLGKKIGTIFIPKRIKWTGKKGF
ncbi:MAG TPA: glutamate 5-kinase [Candidatus Ratteibacteria bacterium]|nr:glutamate 5-kinase [bacterium]HRS06957.1 glutamate 5-kinase [Candidatus Ratteibacteria bacterium]